MFTRILATGMMFTSIILLRFCGGSTPPGATIHIAGRPNDVVLLQMLGTDALSCCKQSQGCKASATVQLDATGQRSVTHMVDNTVYIGYSRLAGGQACGTTEVACSSGGALVCSPITQPTATGQIIIQGTSVSCKKVYDEGWISVCNNTSVSVTIDGTTISRLAVQGTTASTLAQQLASSINADPLLSTKVLAIPSGATIDVQARQSGVEYTFPWQTSCSYVEEYFGACAFRARPSPIATMKVQ
jgi:hypothetical protein